MLVPKLVLKHKEVAFIKNNIKDGLGDVHGSMFLTMNLKKLKENIPNYFGTIEKFLKEEKEIKDLFF